MPTDHKQLVELALSMYDGEECQGCHKKLTPPEVREAVWWPWEGGRIGHEECYLKSISSKTEAVSKP